MKKYLLFVFGNYRNGEDKVSILAEMLAPVVMSQHLKFNYGDYNIVFHFASEIPFSDLEEFMGITVTSFCDQYFLLDATANLSVQMPDAQYQNLFELDSNNHDFNLDKRYINPEKLGIGGNFQTFVPDVLPSFSPSEEVFDVIEEIHTEETIGAEEMLNLILDKIHKEGIESLTSKEKQFLNKNSN